MSESIIYIARFISVLNNLEYMNMEVFDMLSASWPLQAKQGDRETEEMRPIAFGLDCFEHTESLDRKRKTVAAEECHTQQAFGDTRKVDFLGKSSKISSAQANYTLRY